MLHTEYVFEAEEEAQAHLQARMRHLRPTETLTAAGYCSISYLSEMTPSFSHSSSGLEDRVGYT